MHLHRIAPLARCLAPLLILSALPSCTEKVYPKASVRALSLDFTSAHGGLYRDGLKEITDANGETSQVPHITRAGAAFDSVEWKAETGEVVPITHTAGEDRHIDIKLVLDAYALPSDLTYSVKGYCQYHSALCFEGSLADGILIASGTDPIGKKIRKFSASISWTLTVHGGEADGRQIHLGNTGTHVVYTTLDVPKHDQDGLVETTRTPLRMDAAVEHIAQAIADAEGEGDGLPDPYTYHPRIVFHVVKNMGELSTTQNVHEWHADKWISALPEGRPAPCDSLGHAAAGMCLLMGISVSYRQYYPLWAVAGDEDRPLQAREHYFQGLADKMYPGTPLPLAQEITNPKADDVLLMLKDQSGLHGYQSALVCSAPSGGLTWYFPAGQPGLRFTDMDSVVQIFDELVWHRILMDNEGNPTGLDPICVDYDYTAKITRPTSEAWPRNN